MKLSTLVALLAASAGACTTTSSSDITTKGIYASIAARTAGTGSTDVTATLYFGDPLNLDFVTLSGDDQLVATYNGTSKVMTETTILNIVTHDVTFTGGSVGDVFEVSLDRSVDAGAPSSTAALPTEFALDPLPASASRAAPLTVTWGPSGSNDKMTWDATGDCISPASGAIVGDPGTVTIPANGLVRANAQSAPNCNVTVVITRAEDGDLDPHYGKGGTITGEQFRSAAFASTP